MNSDDTLLQGSHAHHGALQRCVLPGGLGLGSLDGGAGVQGTGRLDNRFEGSSSAPPTKKHRNGTRRGGLGSVAYSAERAVSSGSWSREATDRGTAASAAVPRTLADRDPHTASTSGTAIPAFGRCAARALEQRRLAERPGAYSCPTFSAPALRHVLRSPARCSERRDRPSSAESAAIGAQPAISGLQREPATVGGKRAPSRWRFHPQSPLTVSLWVWGRPRRASGDGINLLALRAR